MLRNANNTVKKTESLIKLNWDSFDHVYDYAVVMLNECGFNLVCVAFYGFNFAQGIQEWWSCINPCLDIIRQYFRFISLLKPL